MYSKLHAYTHRLIVQPTVRQVCLLTAEGPDLGDAASSLALQLNADGIGSTTAIDFSDNDHIHSIVWAGQARTRRYYLEAIEACGLNVEGDIHEGIKIIKPPFKGKPHGDPVRYVLKHAGKKRAALAERVVLSPRDDDEPWSWWRDFVRRYDCT